MSVLLGNIGTLLTCAAPGGQGETHAIEAAAVVWDSGLILWAGKESELPERFADAEVQDAGGRLVIPGLVDCHTHLAFGGWRANEFELRSRGATYQEIAASGGGIRSSMRDTRAATTADLVSRSKDFLGQMGELGVTTAECKTGYGLSAHDELRVLDVYTQVAREVPQLIISTLLAAHVVPPEFQNDRSAYVQLVCDEIIPVAAEAGAGFCDVFVEGGAFTADEARTIFEAGSRAGLRPKLHVDQLTDGGGGRLAAEVSAVSADHLEYTSAAGISAMEKAGVVGVALPLASLYLRQPPMNARAFVDAGVEVAVATDFNPGSAPSFHLPFAMTLACTMCGLSPNEAVKGATYYAARAIAAHNIIGSIEPGKRADLAVIDAADANQWLYHLRPNACVRTICAGETIWSARPT